MHGPSPLDEIQIAHAAEDLIREHGDEALTKADDRVKKLNAEGFKSVAKSWELVRVVIEDEQERNLMDGYLHLIAEHMLLTVSEVAKCLRIEKPTVTKWLRDGRMRGYKIGKEWRVSEIDFEAFVESSTNGSSGLSSRR